MRFASFLFLASAAFAADAPAFDAKGAFARLKSMVGNWQADTPMGKAYLTYELVAGTVVEKESFESMPPMMTVYHLDNDHLMLTHYCHAGNQPRMRARSFDLATGEIQFEFLDGTNMASANVGHMHNAKLRLVDNSSYVAEWDFWDKGKKQATETFRYTRVR